MKFSHVALLLVGCAVSAQAFALPDMSSAHELVARGIGGGLRDASGAPQKIGTVNKLLSGVMELARGTVKGLAPSLESVYDILIPSVRILLAASDTHFCRPQTSLELFLWDLKVFLNTQGHEDLGIPVIPLCLPSEEQAPSKELREKITKSHAASKSGINEFTDDSEGATNFGDGELKGDSDDKGKGGDRDDNGKNGDRDDKGPSSELVV